MKYTLTLLLFCAATGPAAVSQTLVPYSDTANNFELQIPKGWYLVLGNKGDDVKFVLTRHDAAGRHPEGFNLMMLKREHSSIQHEAKGLEWALRSTDNFNLTEKDSIVLNGQKWIWLVETHQNDLTKRVMQMVNYDFVTYKDGWTYIMTFVALPESFATYRPLYDQVMKSMVLR